MFKGREKGLYIILSLPSVIYLLTKRKNMVYSFLLLSGKTFNAIQSLPEAE